MDCLFLDPADEDVNAFDDNIVVLICEPHNKDNSIRRRHKRREFVTEYLHHWLSNYRPNFV